MMVTGILRSNPFYGLLIKIMQKFRSKEAAKHVRALGSSWPLKALVHLDTIGMFTDKHTWDFVFTAGFQHAKLFGLSCNKYYNFK